jgi:hypothetical protein
MPVYSFVNKETGEEYETTLAYDELNHYLQDHPEVNQTFRVNVVDPVGIGITKPPSDFMKNVIGKVKEIPGANKSAVEKRWAIPKEL